MNKIYLFILVVVSSLLFGCSNRTSKKDIHMITLVGTSDLQGLMEPFEYKNDVNGTKTKIMGGGIGRIATLFKNIKSENPLGTFVLSSGDDLMGRYFQTFHGKAIYALMSESGYTLYAPGNHEFDKGPALFATALDDASFKTICSDLLITGTALEGKCLPYKVMMVQGTKIGFFSLMTEHFPLITSPGDVKLSASNQATAQKMVQKLQKENCDIIIAITHIGLNQDKIVAKNVTGIDVIFGGHSHVATPKVVRINNTLIVNAGAKGVYIAKLNLPLDAQSHIKKESISYNLIPVIAPIVSDYKVHTTLEDFKAQLPETVVIGQTTVPWVLTTEALRKNESNVAGLINDLLKSKFGVDVVMNNAGAFRGKQIYPVGDITDTMLHAIDEFANNVYILSIKGKYLRQILERSATLYGKGGLMQVSGIKYTIDLSKQAQEIKKSDGNWTIKKEGKRVTQINIINSSAGLEPLDDTKIYKVLSNSYLVNNAGDGYFWFKKYGINQINTYTTFYTIMAGYLQTHKFMNPPALDGRLTIFNK